MKTIYGIFEKETNKPMYIGRGNYKDRIITHKYRAKKGHHYPIYEWMRANTGNYYFEAILEVDDCYATTKENEYMWLYQDTILNINFMNKMSDAQKSKMITTHSDESKSKMSAAHQGKTHSVATKSKISAAHQGKTISEEHKAKISAAKLGKKRGPGKPRSNETKAKISATIKGKTISEEHKAKMMEKLEPEIINSMNKININEGDYYDNY